MHRPIRQRLARIWRIAATGFCFAVFGLGGLVMRLFAFPLLALLVRDRQRQVLAARRLIQLAMRGFVELMRATGVIRYRITGLERLQRTGLLILANHPTLIDTVLLMAFVRHADCIVKNALWRNPFTRGPVQAAGYISNDQGPELIEDCINSIRAGSNLIIFPEGTRTPRDGNISFKRGAANVAVRGVCAITPVVIRCTPATLGKGCKWWDVPPTTAHFSIDIGQDIDLRQAIDAACPDTAAVEIDNPGAAARRLTHYLQHYFMKES
ncbi:1-acyl-sn-glycerol-3-phosphate acyltransferase [Herbaspirillum sp. YR522]|uniref:lysophospholipid acyltransferase family protein n=1 Tax=Herbaspirillum sp. YR522 TaxID=1144342 RepID=UPI00026F5342|nr:lysophospholipid acyltransferase family protein [Herbaspirillum sp. YR522]EJN09275.1 1-acyl-sn-glycerol-3-phosphate acyltransferase [Herbaspirillum sp. YR522]